MRTFVVVSLVAIAVTCLALALMIVVTKLHRMGRQRARDRRLELLRPDLLAVAAGEDGDEDGPALRRLLAVDGPAREDVDDLAVRLLATVRGEPAIRLVGLLRAHGRLRRAHAQARSMFPSRRVKALAVIGRSRDWEGADLAIAALEDRSARVRSQAARTVGLVGDPRAARPLLEALRLEGIHVSDAAESLGGLGFGISDALLWALEEGSVRARTVAAHLCGSGGVRASAPLLVTLVESDPDPVVAATAATALGKVGRPQDLGALAAASLHFFPFVLRRAAMEALGELGVPRAAPVLVRHLEDPQSQLGETAAGALVALGPVGLRALLEHEHLPAARSALALARLQGVTS